MSQVVDAYYRHSILSPLKIKTRDKDGKVSFKVEYMTTYSTAPAQIVADATKIRSAIRQERVLDHMRFSESHCVERIESVLCKPVSAIRAYLDEYDTSPIFSQGSRDRTEVVRPDTQFSPAGL